MYTVLTDHIVTHLKFIIAILKNCGVVLMLFFLINQHYFKLETISYIHHLVSFER